MKIRAAVLEEFGAPLAVRTARTHESSVAADVLAALRSRRFTPETAVLDLGYDVGPVYDACERNGCLPIIPLRKTPSVKRGAHRPPTCEHGIWTFAGADFKRGASKWRCPSGECKPASVWIKSDRLHPLVPRKTNWGTTSTVDAGPWSASSAA
ncbi:MAG: transposase [Gaiellaceae bacterium]